MHVVVAIGPRRADPAALGGGDLRGLDDLTAGRLVGGRDELSRSMCEASCFVLPPVPDPTPIKLVLCQVISPRSWRHLLRPASFGVAKYTYI